MQRLHACKMNAKTSDLFFIKRRKSTVSPQVFEVEDGEDTKTEPTVTTMADCVRPLLTSMKLFGLYFKCGTEAGDNIMTNAKSRRRWNAYMIYASIVAILLWINVARMSSVFKNVLLCHLPFLLSCTSGLVFSLPVIILLQFHA